MDATSAAFIQLLYRDIAILLDGRPYLFGLLFWCLVVFEYCLTAGFRLPLPSHYALFLEKLTISPVQLFPNSWRFLTGYSIRCNQLGITPGVDHMTAILTVRQEKGMVHLAMPKLEVITKPSNVGLWRKKWFLARDPSFKSLNCRLYANPPTPLVLGKPEDVARLKKAFKNKKRAFSHKTLITQKNLERAGLSLPLRG